MNTDLDYLLNVKPSRVSRREFLEPLAKKLKLNPKRYKNRLLLHKAICSKMQNPSTRCENTCDPITLTPIDEIEEQFLFEWDQNDKHFGADIRSLKAMIKKKCTILPWAIDEASGIAESSDHDTYVAKYDMKNVAGLIEKIENTVSESYNYEYEKVPLDVKYRAQIESSTSEYVSHIIDFLHGYNEYKQFYYSALQRVCQQFNGELFEGHALSIKNVIKLNMLEQISQTVVMSDCKKSLELLVICLNTIQVYFDNNSQNIIDLFFMMMNSLKNEITDNNYGNNTEHQN